MPLGSVPCKVSAWTHVASARTRHETSALRRRRRRLGCLPASGGRGRRRRVRRGDGRQHHDHDEELYRVSKSLKTEATGTKLKRKEYEAELRQLHAELVALQEWVKSSGAKVCVVFEGRDSAGKGGTIKAITDRVSPRVF